jgi:hypothetical protein
VHSGSGKVFVEENEFPQCPKIPSEKRAKEDKVNVTVMTGLPVVTAGVAPLDCVGLTDSTTESKSIGSVKLSNGRRTITCTQTLEDPRTDFKKTININLDFNYLSSADKEVLVKHLVNE